MKTWRSDEVFTSKLADFLNQITAHGGTVFAVLPSARADRMFIVWYTAASH